MAPSGPSTCSYHPTFLSRYTPVDVVAVMEVAEHRVLFFAALVHQTEVTMTATSTRETRSTSPSPALPPPPIRPTTLQPQVHVRRGPVYQLPVQW